MENKIIRVLKRWSHLSTTLAIGIWENQLASVSLAFLLCKARIWKPGSKGHYENSGGQWRLLKFTSERPCLRGVDVAWWPTAYMDRFSHFLCSGALASGVLLTLEGLLLPGRAGSQTVNNSPTEHPFQGQINQGRGQPEPLPLLSPCTLGHCQLEALWVPDRWLGTRQRGTAVMYYGLLKWL